MAEKEGAKAKRPTRTKATPEKKISTRKSPTATRKRTSSPRIKKNVTQKPEFFDQAQSLEQKVEESKYYSSPVVHKYEEPGFNLPHGYGDNRIVAMVRDPYWLYCYWEINDGKVQEIRAELGYRFYQSSLILRIYNTEDWSFFDLNVSGEIGNWYINVGRPNTSYCIDIGYLTSDGTFVCAARSNIVVTPRDRVSEVIDEEWMIPDWERIYALSGGLRIGQGSFSLKKLMEKNFSITSPGISSWSSPTKKPQERPFFLVANCELIVYGATEPTAKLTIQGVPVKLRPDGSFSVRFTLPDGKQVIPIEAVRDDGMEKRKITPKIERQTE